jgi:hypothetical protein
VIRADEDAARVDPAVFVAPYQSPPFREVIKGAEWDKQFAAALGTLGDLEALCHSAFPSAGTRIGEVDPDGQGARRELVEGDIIAEVDGEALNQGELNAFRKEGDQKLTIVGRDGVARQLTISAGKLGISITPMLRPELVYLREGARDPKWDAYAAVGAAFCRVNPGLAETAWHHAIEAGYVPDAVSDFCGAHLAWRGGRMEEALAYCAMLRSRKKIPAALDVEALGYALEIASFKMEQALARRANDAAGPARVEGDVGELLQTLLAAHRQRAEAERLGPSPSEIASYVKSNLLKQMAPRLQDNKEFDDYAKWVRDQLARQQGPLHMEAQTDSYDTVMQMPKVDAADVELSVDVKLKRFDSHAGGFAKCMTIALVNCDDPELIANGFTTPNERMLNMEIDTNGLCLIHLKSRDGVLVQRVSVAEEIANNRQFKLRLLHAAGREEVWIDRRRLLYLPACEKPKRIGFHFRTVGAKADLRVSFYKLDPRLAPGG